MNHYDFAQLCTSTNKEEAIGVLFDEAQERWDESGLDSLTEGQITLLAVELFFGEVLNGGFYQYFSNQSGSLTVVAPNALRRVRLDPYAEILEDFLRLFPDGQPSHDDEQRQR